MPEYVREADRIEAALPARICWDIACSIARHNPMAGEVMKPIIDGFDLAVRLVFEGVFSPCDRAKMERRLERLCDAALDEFRNDSVAKVLSAFHFWIEDLQEREIIEIGNESVFRRTWEAFTGVLMMASENDRILAGVDKSAQKAAKRLRKRLERSGYFLPSRRSA